MERTFHKLKRRHKIEEEQDLTKPTPKIVNEDEQRRTFENCVPLGVHSLTPNITRLPVTTTNFELKPMLISMVQQLHFGNTPMDNPNLHILVFLEAYNTLKITGASSDTTYLRLFSFSLGDKANT